MVRLRAPVLLLRPNAITSCDIDDVPLLSAAMTRSDWAPDRALDRAPVLKGAAASPDASATDSWIAPGMNTMNGPNSIGAAKQHGPLSRQIRCKAVQSLADLGHLPEDLLRQFKRRRPASPYFSPAVRLRRRKGCRGGRLTTSTYSQCDDPQGLRSIGAYPDRCQDRCRVHTSTRVRRAAGLIGNLRGL